MPLRNFGPFVSSGRAKTPLRGLLQLPCLFNPFDFRGCKRKRTSEYHLISYYLYCHIYATRPALSLVSNYTLLGPSVYLRLETAPVFKNQISPGVSKMTVSHLSELYNPLLTADNCFRNNEAPPSLPKRYSTRSQELGILSVEFKALCSLAKAPFLWE